MNGLFMKHPTIVIFLMSCSFIIFFNRMLLGGGHSEASIIVYTILECFVMQSAKRELPEYVHLVCYASD